ncbi:glycopeptide antibiotics resistance protein [Clostridiales Family XIII bacterium PM5-7]
MTHIISGIAYLTKAMVISIPIYIIFFAYQRMMRKKTDSLYFQHFLLLTYTIVLGFITGVVNIHQWSFDFDSIAFNAVPFTNESLLLIVLNVVLFVPYGILVPLLWKKADSWKRIFIYGILTSFSIEMIQMLFIGRLADIDDLIANTIGCLLGYAFFQLLSRLIEKHNVKTIGTGTHTLILSSFAMVWEMGYKGVTTGDFVLYNLGINTFQTELHYSGLITIGIAIISFIFGVKYKEDFLANSSIFLSIISACIAVMHLL